MNNEYVDYTLKISSISSYCQKTQSNKKNKTKKHHV